MILGWACRSGCECLKLSVGADLLGGGVDGLGASEDVEA